MADASYVQSSFVGGEWSKFAQGRYHDPAYRKAMNVCLNGIPIESEAWVRRPGFGFAATTRSGAPGRVISFDFEEVSPYTMEFTDSHLRFFAGKNLVTTNDNLSVVSVTNTNPAVVQLILPVSWNTGDQVFFYQLGTTCPLLQNRVFILTKIDTTHFSLTDAVTGVALDGTTIGAISSSAAISRILDFTTPYVGSAIATLRSVQAEKTAFLLNGGVKPYALVVNSDQSNTLAGFFFATFSLAPAVFNDGPYLDPFTNGAQVVPSGTKGIITLTLAFPTWDATIAYAAGAFVVFSAVCYKSLADQNVNQQPNTSPAFWQATSADQAVAVGGLRGTDVGRLVRLYSEPDVWNSAASYSVGNVVSYNPSGLPGQATYWSALAINTNKPPGTDVTNWQVLSNPTLWSWGKITGFVNAINAAGSNIGSMTGNAGLAAAFDGVLTKIGTNCAADSNSFVAPDSGNKIDAYIGKNYSTPQIIQQATVYPASDVGFCASHYLNPPAFALAPQTVVSIVINLRAKNSAPASASDGTLLATTTLLSNQTLAVTLTSGDQSTAWSYVWFEIIPERQGQLNTSFTAYVAQAVFFNPPGAGITTGFSLEVLGAPLLYTTPIRTWRLGLYSDTTGWPTCGTYSDGRLWLSGAIPNRVDACVSNGIVGGTVNFAPTDQFGNVLASSGISYVFNAEDVNPIFWMIPELQGIICGTKAGEWLIQAPTSGGITPLNISARRTTKVGVANIEPRKTEHTTVFTQKFGRKIIEYFADVFSGKYTAPNLASNAKHLTIGGIQEIAYQQELAPIIWARVNNALRGITYKRDTLMTSQGPTMFGWHKHTLGSGRVVESIAVGPSFGGNLDTLTIISNDPATNIRHVELLGDILDEGSSLSQASYLDDAVTPTSTTSSSSTPAPYGGLTLNGLWHLNGKTVQAWLGGLDCGDYVVSNGSITVPYGDGVSAGTGNGLFTAAFVSSFTTFPMTVGFTFTSQGQITRPHTREESGARTGPAFGKVRRSQWLMMQFEGTQGVSLGTTFTNLQPALFKDARGNNLLMNQQFSGIFRDKFTDDYSFDGMLCWQVTRPYICNIAAVGASLQTQDT